MFRHRTIIAWGLVGVAFIASPQAQTTTEAELYAAACAACHGVDGTGHPAAAVGFETPLPDFTDCSFATREPDTDWFAIVHQGGPVRAFDRMMPAYGQALPEADIQRILDHVRGFCPNRAWPRGELNLPRPLVTEKAYPEDEAVLTLTTSRGAEAAVTTEFLYERRFGARHQIEIVVPLEQQRSDGSWRRGLGDLAVAFKRAQFHSLDTGTIVSLAGELVFPTRKEAAGEPGAVTVFEPFVAWGQMLPSDGFFHVQAGLEVPLRGDADNEGFWRAAAGKSFTEGRFGRTWSPMVEVLGARELVGGEASLWDVVPQMQVTLSRRQHVMINGGVRIPLNDRAERRARVIVYLLWDWFDGALMDGWR
jgi:hypothetical protein